MEKLDVIGIDNKAEDKSLLTMDKDVSPEPHIYIAVPADLKGYLHKKIVENGMHTIKGDSFESGRTTARTDGHVENGNGVCGMLDDLYDSRSKYSANTSSKKHFPVACYSIILLQMCIFLAMVATQGFASFSDNPFLGPPTQSINTYGAKNPEKIRHGEIWRALTAIFQSVGFLDLFFSSGMLLCFGATVEARWGTIKWLFVYLASGICGNLYSSFLVEPMVVSVGDGGSILGLLGFVHIEMISSIILSASKTRGHHNNDGNSSSSHHHTNSSFSGAPSSHKKRRRARKRGTTSVGSDSSWSYHELPVFLQQRQSQKQQQQQDIEEQRYEQDKIEEDKYYLHSAVTAIGMLIGIIVTFSVEWVLDHFRLVATHEDDYSYYYPSSPTTTASSHGGRHQYYMKKDWSVLYGGLMTGILCGCIWNICNLNYDMDRRTVDRVRLFYGLTLVTIPMLMVGVYSINSTM